MISGRRQGSLLSLGFSPGASAKNIMARSWGRLQAQGSPTAIDGLSGAQSTVFTRLGLGAPQSSELRPGAQDYFGAFVCVVFAGTLVKSFLFSCLPRMAPASLLGFSPVSSHRGKKKKRSCMFGKICRSVERFLYWCKRRGGQRGRGSERQSGAPVRSWPRAPTHVPLLGRGPLSWVVSILDPFSRPAVFTLLETPIIPPQ